ncbi:MAG: hypothetical protein K0S39_963 [Paenibacillus sp.]|nr:hypothetical protein [Paenibacillus sp.]
MERWGVFELSLEYPFSGNPFTDIRLSAQFQHEACIAEAEGFYDGNGKFRIRFMPDEEGIWTYTTSSNRSGLDGITGQFACTKPSPGNHGPVRIMNNVHFQYADGKRFTPIGTACYGWHLQSEEMQELTLRTLEHSPFNKVRMGVLPQLSMFSNAATAWYPFEGSPELGFDYNLYRPDYFALLEKRIQDLAVLGIQAEIVLFHPDDEEYTCYESLTPEEDDRYLRYVIARLGAYRNVWWLLADEYDGMKNKKLEDWDRLLRIVREYDYGAHLCSVLNRNTWYDFGSPWITHASIRHADVRVASECTKQYGKPVIIDDCGCEGNLDTRWGSLTPEELACRIWEGHFRGGYVTHGETYLHPDEILWGSHGGELRGKSIPRIEFLRGILEEAPAHMTYSSDRLDAATLEVRGEYYLQYFGPHRFAYREFALPEGKYEADVIDTWNMTVTPVAGMLEGRFRIDLPAKLYYALRIRKVSDLS